MLRPQRPPYSLLDLGPRYFTLLDCIYLRTDFHLLNPRGLKLKCSFFQSTAGSETCVVYCHGNCGNRLDAMEVLELVLSLGMSVCAFDFSGSGQSEGEYVSFAYYEREDIGAVVDHLRRARGVSEVVLWGRSMGAVAAILYASGRSDIKAVVADSPFVSMQALLVDIINSYIRLPDFLSSFLISRLQAAVQQQAGFDFR